MIRCLIVDDEKPAIAVLKRFIERMPELELIGTTNKPLAGIQMIDTERPDVVFLDIQMGPMNGIELARAIGNNTKIVFCTAHFEYAVQSYELNAIDYLLKPIEFPRFKIAVQKVSDAITGRATPVEAIKDDYILVKQGDKGKFKKIEIDDIVFVEAMNNYVLFICTTDKTMAYLTLKELEDRLPACNFLRVHKSFIISVKGIRAIHHNEIIIKGEGGPIPIGASYKEVFLDHMKNKLM